MFDVLRSGHISFSCSPFLLIRISHHSCDSQVNIFLPLIRGLVLTVFEVPIVFLLSDTINQLAHALALVGTMEISRGFGGYYGTERTTLQ